MILDQEEITLIYILTGRSKYYINRYTLQGGMNMRRISWVKSIVTFGIIIILIGIMISIYGFIEYCTQKAADQAVEEYKQSQEPKDIVISTQ